MVPCKDFVVEATSWRVATLVATNWPPAEPRRRNADLNEGEHEVPSNLDFHRPLPVLSQLLACVPGINAAYIYGSWAARYHHEPGGPPNDLDVLVIGAAD